MCVAGPPGLLSGTTMLRALLAACALATATATHAASDREVFEVSPLVDGAIIASASATSLLLSHLEPRIARLRCPCDRDEVPRFERFAIGLRSEPARVASDVTLWLALAVPPIAGLAVVGPNRAFLQDATVFAEALAVSGALVSIVKSAVQRPIPRAYANDPAHLRDPGSYRAFYSGHTTIAFTALTDAAWTARLRFGEQVWPWAVAGLAGTSVGVERVLAGRHFPTDVLAGALVGIAVGTAVPLLHERSRADRSRSALVPTRHGLAFSGMF